MLSITFLPGLMYDPMRLTLRAAGLKTSPAENLVVAEHVCYQLFVINAALREIDDRIVPGMLGLDDLPGLRPAGAS